MTEVGKVKDGDHVVISGAAGAVGLVSYVSNYQIPTNRLT